MLIATNHAFNSSILYIDTVRRCAVERFPQKQSRARSNPKPKSKYKPPFHGGSRNAAVSRSARVWQSQQRSGRRGGGKEKGREKAGPHRPYRNLSTRPARDNQSQHRESNRPRPVWKGPEDIRAEEQREVHRASEARHAAPKAYSSPRLQNGGQQQPRRYGEPQKPQHSASKMNANRSPHRRLQPAPHSRPKPLFDSRDNGGASSVQAVDTLTRPEGYYETDQLMSMMLKDIRSGGDGTGHQLSPRQPQRMRMNDFTATPQRMTVTSLKASKDRAERTTLQPAQMSSPDVPVVVAQTSPYGTMIAVKPNDSYNGVSRKVSGSRRRVRTRNTTSIAAMIAGRA